MRQIYYRVNPKDKSFLLCSHWALPTCLGEGSLEAYWCLWGNQHRAQRGGGRAAPRTALSQVSTTESTLGCSPPVEGEEQRGPVEKHQKCKRKKKKNTLRVRNRCGHSLVPFAHVFRTTAQLYHFRSDVGPGNQWCGWHGALLQANDPQASVSLWNPLFRCRKSNRPQGTFTFLMKYFHQRWMLDLENKQ